ncbi:hypothetical protein GQ43DRAFT_21768 [Delitschia confertaspora ATCC 74209]|uniref:HCP-like protein n=1 Tax=Delitschia confertaspora ATCC 74209 TaxID=1513339 RepID=A0A9P4JRF0_9PLEO|nr:hypothetical protein GQ43DRAFT_21768 [Delitschia confertaspora ATCC 74209]
MRLPFGRCFRPFLHPTKKNTMANREYRPGGMESRSESYEFVNNASNPPNLSLGDLPSPRVGEIPPALSPLDALALQGRLLAKRFEQANKSGRRISRLAPLTIQNEFGNRGGYFSSLSPSTAGSSHDEPISPHPAFSPRETKPQERHKSVYPQLQEDDLSHDQPFPFRNNLAPVAEGKQAQPVPQDYFGVVRTRSPEPGDARIGFQEAPPVMPNIPRSNNGPQAVLNRQRMPSIDSLSVKAHQPGLLPPRSPGSFRSPRHSPSIRSVREDSSDEVEDMSLAGSYDSSQLRQFSPERSVSRSHSPFSPRMTQHMRRSPSVSSEFSTTGFPRPAFNFSRPLSTASRQPSLDLRTSVDAPVQQPSDENAMMRPSFDNYPPRQDSADGYVGDVVHTPVSMTSEDFRRSSDSHNNPAPSYTYTKFDLPRGRPLGRRSIRAEDFLNSQIHWDQPVQNPNKPQQTSYSRPPSPPSPPQSLDRPRTQPEPEPEPAPLAPTASSERPVAPSLTSSKNTIRARPSGSSDVTAQEHCDKGVELHEAGEFMKSTYHLRLAARAGLPEGMFWYGLACRHGWGMRENKAEAMQWLRRAVDSGQLEIANDEDQDRQGRPADVVKRKKHQAQYAAAIYELGKCYAEGWGTRVDKSLALRYFEIAGNWGDSDALTEAGYYYCKGIGCKKDMSKAAKLYRAAEAKGVSMVGNSWIHKEKYMDAGPTSDARSVRSGRPAEKEMSKKKPRDKSRTRTIFGRNKSFQT